MASKRKLGFLIDHCVDAEISRYLSRLRGVKVLSFDDVGLTQRSIDPHVIEKATQAGAMLITNDKRFTEKSIPCCTHIGIIKFNTRLTIRLRSFQKFMRLKEKHLAWKGVTHLYEEQAVIHQHNGETLAVSYRQ